MTKTEKYYTQIKKMSSEDKRAYILRLVSRLDNVEYNASALLHTEIEHFGLGDNQELTSCLAKLQIMEQHLNQLNKKYEVEYHNTVIPMVRGFRQEQEKLNQEHKQNQLQFIQHRAPVLLAEQVYLNQEREMEHLKERQAKQKLAIIKQMSEKINNCKRNIQNVFTNAVEKIYQ